MRFHLVFYHDGVWELSRHTDRRHSTRNVYGVVNAKGDHIGPHSMRYWEARRFQESLNGVLSKRTRSKVRRERRLISRAYARAVATIMGRVAYHANA
jgi:hypothetical protein